MRCKRKKKAAIQLCTFPARNLTVLACFSPRAGRRALNTNENCFHIFKNREQSPLKSLSRCLPESSQGVQPCLPEIIWLVQGLLWPTGCRHLREMRVPVFRIVVEVEVVHGLLPLGELLSLQEFCSPSPKENILFICIQSSGSSGSDSTN